MSSRLILRVVPFSACLFFCTPLFADQNQQIKIDASIQSSAVDNANRQANPQMTIDELQHTGVLGVGGDIKRKHWQALLDYSLEGRRYEEQQEQDVNLLLGRGKLQLGDRDNSPLLAQLIHIAEEVLIDQTRGDAPDNLDQRKSSRGEIILGLGDVADRVELIAYRERDRFRIEEANNGTRDGGLITYMRGANAYTRYGVEFDAYRSEYDTLNETFEYRRAALRLVRASRRLKMDIALGANSTDGDSDLETPYYNIQMAYRQGYQQWVFNAGRFITDTSQGNRSAHLGGAQAELAKAEQDELQPEPADKKPQANASLRVVDRYESQQSGLLWRLQPSARYAFSLAGNYVKEAYESAFTEDSTSRQWVAGFDYTFSPRTRFTASATRDNVDFDFRDNYTQMTLRAEWTYGGVFKHGEFGLFAESTERDQQQGGFEGYETSRIGLRFDYRLLGRN